MGDVAPCGVRRFRQYTSGFTDDGQGWRMRFDGVPRGHPLDTAQPHGFAGCTGQGKEVTIEQPSLTTT